MKQLAQKIIVCQWLGRVARAHRFLVFGVCLFGVGSRCVRADAATTQPTTQKSPQETLAQWNDGRLGRITLDQATSFYSANTDSEKEMAGIMAAQAIATAKLEQAVRQIWGSDAEAAVARICVDNTPSDDAQATWIISGDHAVARFKVDGMAPLLLVRVQGQWKIDVAGYVADLGNQLPAGLQFMRASTDVLENATDQLTKKNAFNSADDFEKSLKEQMDKLNAGN
jgi:hypothetical protein